MKAKKKFLAMVLAALLALAVVTPVMASDVTVFVDGAQVQFADQGPVLVDGHTLVPVRAVFEHLSVMVDWVAETNEVVLTRDSFGYTYVVTIAIGNTAFAINDTSQSFDVAPRLVGDRAVVQLRPIIVGLGFDINWDSATNRVLISTSLDAFDYVDEPQPEPYYESEYELYEPVEEEPAYDENGYEGENDYEYETSYEDELVEDEPVAETAPGSFVGAWYWDGYPVLNLFADGTGIEFDMDDEQIDISWTTENGLFILYSSVFGEDIFEYEFDGNNLVFVCVVSDLVIYLTRG